MKIKKAIVFMIMTFLLFALIALAENETLVVPEGGAASLGSSVGEFTREDKIWLVVSNALLLPNQGKVWDVNLGWQSSPVPLNQVTSSSGSSPVVVGSGEDAYDAIILEAAQTFGVDAALIKAIIKHESDFRPKVISSTGCSGLMQVCGGSEDSTYISVWCNQDRDIGPQSCNGQQDQRFIVYNNIMSGTSTFKKKMDLIPICGAEKIKAVISAYNIGEGIVKSAITANGNKCDDWTNVWNKINENFDPVNKKIFTYQRPYYTQGKVNNQNDLVGFYVGDVYADYQKYKDEGFGT